MALNAKNYEYLKYEEFEKLQDTEQRFKIEFDNGHIYYMSPVHPNHDRIKTKVATSLVNHIGFKGPCEVFTSDVAVVFEKGSRKFEYQPDIMVCCGPDKFQGSKYKGIPKLVIEILSYTTQDRDKGIKLSNYEEFGVDEYWIVNAYDEEIIIYNNNSGNKFMSCNIYKSGMIIQWENGFSIAADDVFSVLK